MDDIGTLAPGLLLALFFIGGLLTTLAPPLLDKSWAKPV